MKYFFWIGWSAEMILAIWWIFTELKLEYLKPNPFAFAAFLYLIVVLVIRVGAVNTGLSNVLVMIPAVPLLLMGLLVLVHSMSGQRWN